MGKEGGLGHVEEKAVVEMKKSKNAASARGGYLGPA